MRYKLVGWDEMRFAQKIDNIIVINLLWLFYIQIEDTCGAQKDQ